MLAPADEISGEIIFDYSKEWIATVYNRTNKEFGDTYGDHTGKLLFKAENDFTNYRDSSFEYKGWTLTLGKITDKLAGELQTKLKVNGNPSKIFFGDKNYRNPPVEEFKKIIADFGETFELPLDKIKLTIPCEASVTIADPDDLFFNEETIKGRFICFQGKAFDIMRNRLGNFMGYEANNAHYTKKVYLPAIKFNEHLNYLRIEASYNRVKTFKLRTGIDTWADLVSDEGMYQAYKVVLFGLDGIVVYDPTLRRSKGYPDYLNEMIYRGWDIDYWLKEFSSSASDKTLKKRLEEYRMLSFQKGEGLHVRVRKWIQNEAEKFRNVTTWVTCNNSEYNRDIIIKDCYSNINTKQMNTTSDLKRKSKKQLAKEKRELNEKQFQSFLKALGIILQKAETQLA